MGQVCSCGWVTSAFYQYGFKMQLYFEVRLTFKVKFPSIWSVILDANFPLFFAMQHSC